MDSFIYNLTKSPVSLWHFIPLGKGAGGSAPYGICPAPDCFQQQLDHCLEGLKGVYRIADDLLIIGQEDTDEKAVLDHDQNLKNLLERCRARNIKLNKRFQFKSRAMSFIGHVMIMNGLNAGREEVEAVIKMEQPAADVTAVQRFTGLVKYLSKFQQDLSEMCEPLWTLNTLSNCWICLFRVSQSVLALLLHCS